MKMELEGCERMSLTLKSHTHQPEGQSYTGKLGCFLRIDTQRKHLKMLILLKVLAKPSVDFECLLKLFIFG